MATYNGARWLPPFLASVAAQDWPALRVVASDDGSTDDTLAVLESFAGRAIAVHRNAGRQGFAGNFANAIRHTDARYVALADQDDWWRTDKIARLVATAQALEAEHGVDTPVLVFSDIEVVDERLATISPSLFAGGAGAAGTLTFADYLFGNHVPGCAMLLNRALIGRAMPIPDEVAFHDWWFSLVAAGLGRVAAVDAPLIKYRQHGGNTLGAIAQAPPGPMARLRAKVADPLGLLRQRARTVAQIGGMMAVTLTAYRAHYASALPPERRALLDLLLDGSPLARLGRFRSVRSAGGRVPALAVSLLLGSRLLPLPDQASSGTSQ